MSTLRNAVCPIAFVTAHSTRHSLALRALDHIIESPRLTDEAKLAALPCITLEFVHSTFRRFVRDAFVTTFACGSVTSDMSAAFCRFRTHAFVFETVLIVLWGELMCRQDADRAAARRRLCSRRRNPSRH